MENKRANKKQPHKNTGNSSEPNVAKKFQVIFHD